jgi:hypothetical protein
MTDPVTLRSCVHHKTVHERLRRGCGCFFGVGVSDTGASGSATRASAGRIGQGSLRPRPARTAPLRRARFASVGQAPYQHPALGASPQADLVPRR